MPVDSITEHVLFRLAKTDGERFFWSVASRLNVRELRGEKLKEEIPTAAIGPARKGSGYTVFVNPDFMKDQERVSQMVGVLKHEMLHLILRHITDDRLHNLPSGERESSLMNIAMDLEINSFLPESQQPNEGVYPGQGIFEEVPAGKSAEAYWDLLLDLPKDEQDEMVEAYQNMQVGSHDQMGSQGSTLEDKLRGELMDDIIEDAYQKGEKEGWGNMPHKDQLRQRIEIGGEKISWERALQNFLSTILSEDRFSTYRRRNRRFSEFPGYQQEPDKRIAVSVDQSGSMSDEELKKFGKEMNSLARETDFTVIPFDATVDKDCIYHWEKDETKLEIPREKCGGTDFNAPTNHVNEKNCYDGHIIYTDGLAPKPVSSQCPRLWVISGEGELNFETSEPVINMDLDQ